MTQHTSNLSAPAAGKQKPRLGLMGEFSVGKSTLTNLLLGTNPLPVKVTATRLPPVWISYGSGPACAEDLNGNQRPINVANLEEVELEETRVIRLFLEADILKLCDLIDMPGISDPNMSSEVWRNVTNEIDAVIWCTHATQAWRQSEAAVWEAISDQMSENSLLLLTRFDKLQSDRDRKRVLARVARETADLFAGTYPISLTEALAAVRHRKRWEKSGAADFVNRLVEILLDPKTRARQTGDQIQPDANPKEHSQADSPATADSPDQAPRIMPSRVRVRSDSDVKPVRPVAGQDAPHAKDYLVQDVGNA